MLREGERPSGGTCARGLKFGVAVLSNLNTKEWLGDEIATTRFAGLAMTLLLSESVTTKHESLGGA
jgi:hypothetical protein